MGKREIRRWSVVTLQSGACLALSGMVLLGALSGCFVGTLADGQGLQELEVHLRQYFMCFGKNETTIPVSSVLWSRGQHLLMAALLGETLFGIVGLPLLLAERAFVLSFSIAVCYRIFGSAGLWSAGVLFGVPALFWFPALLLVGGHGLVNGLLKCQRKKNDAGTIVQQQKREYTWIVCVVSLLAGGTFLESKMVPFLAGLVLRVS